MTKLPILRIDSPCSVRWNEMDGDQSVRRCPACDHAVHNFSAMSSEEVRQLLEGRLGERLCAVLFSWGDGSFATRDHPEAVPKGIRYVTRVAHAVLGAAILASTAVAQTPAEQPTSTSVTEPTGISVMVKNEAGKVVPGLQLSVKRVSGDQVATGATNSEGHFEAMRIAPGHYLVQFEGTGTGTFSVRVLVKRAKITEFEQRVFMQPFVGEVVIKEKHREIKPKN